MNITILSKEYTVKASLRAMLKYEEQTGKSFAVSTLTDQINFFYACLCAYNEQVLSKEDFITALDEDETLFTTFASMLLNATTAEESGGEEKKNKA